MGPRKFFSLAARSPLGLVVAVSFLVLQDLPTRAQERIPRVLLLHPHDNTLPATTVAGEALRQRLGERMGGKIEFYSDFLDLIRFPDEMHGQRTANFLAEKYAQKRPDLVVTLSTESQRFATKYRNVFAPDVPILFCCASRALIESVTERPSDVTGIIIEYDITKTLELAERLQPNARNLVLVSGASEIDRRYLEMFRGQLAPHEARFSMTYLVGLSHDDLLARVSKLPRDTIVLLGTIFSDATGRLFVPVDAGADVAAAASAPTYAPLPPFLGRGIVGGYIGTFEGAGTETADLAAEILGGADPRTIAPRSSAAQRFRVDARQLDRWNLSATDLPAETVMNFEQPTLWEEHRNVVIAITAVISVQAVLITLLLIQFMRRRRAEVSLRDSEQRWRSVFETSTVGIALADREMKYLAANGAFQAMLGYEEDELRGRSAIDIADDEYRDLARKGYQDICTGDRQSYELMQQCRRKDGTPVWVHNYVSAIPGSDSKPRFFMETTIDITDRKHAEQAMQAAQSELARANRLTTMGEMAASIAHEVNQPLAAIVANSNAGLRWLANSSPNLEEAKSAFTRIVKDGHRAGEVISTIRAMFRKGTSVRANIDINELVREVLALVQGELHRNGISVRTRFLNAPPPVLADRVQLQQVILNLVMNAVEAMAAVADRPRRLRITSEIRKPQGLLITVEDSGSGIAPDNVEHIFDAFYTTKANGMGMGLAICRSIVEAHGGSLAASRAHPHGTVFQVILPVAGPETSNESEAREPVGGVRH